MRLSRNSWKFPKQLHRNCRKSVSESLVQSSSLHYSRFVTLKVLPCQRVLTGLTSSPCTWLSEAPLVVQQRAICVCITWPWRTWVSLFPSREVHSRIRLSTYYPTVTVRRSLNSKSRFLSDPRPDCTVQCLCCKIDGHTVCASVALALFWITLGGQEQRRWLQAPTSGSTANRLWLKKSLYMTEKRKRRRHGKLFSLSVH